MQEPETRHAPARGLYPFEETDETLATLPLAGRRVLDVLGRKLSLEGWLSLGRDERWRIVRAGAAREVDPGVLSVVESAAPAPAVVTPQPDPDGAAPPEALLVALGPARPLAVEVWRALAPLDRYALAKYVARPEKLDRAYEGIVGAVRLSHLTAEGRAHMVDVGTKPESLRRAVAGARVRTTRAVLVAVTAGATAKGDVLGAARIAGIMAAKRTAELVPLCHPVRVTRVGVEFEPDLDREELCVRATVEAFDRTGVEMEAMVAASVASLTVYDMIKSADRWASIDHVALEEKSGGKSGDVRRPPERSGRG